MHFITEGNKQQGNICRRYSEAKQWNKRSVKNKDAFEMVTFMLWKLNIK